METKKHYLNEDGFSEYRLECGCISTNVPGFGWTSILCDTHQDIEDDLYYIPQKLGKFRPHQHN